MRLIALADIKRVTVCHHAREEVRAMPAMFGSPSTARGPRSMADYH
jgi:hypothetical protein